MLIIPAIDIYEGKAVRLTGRDFNKKTVYGSEPWKTARSFADAGCTLIHVVDLDGAKNGSFRNYEVIKRIVKESNARIQAGGGIRTEDDASRLFDAGVERVVVGSVAVTHPEKFARSIELFGHRRIVVAVDAKNGSVMHSGWTKSSKDVPRKVMRRLGKAGARIFICTDIGRDGTLTGPNVTLYKELCIKFPDYEIIASGGVSSIEDLNVLRETGVTGAIAGKALYEGKIDLSDLKIKNKKHETNNK